MSLNNAISWFKEYPVEGIFVVTMLIFCFIALTSVVTHEITINKYLNAPVDVTAAYCKKLCIRDGRSYDKLFEEFEGNVYNMLRYLSVLER